MTEVTKTCPFCGVWGSDMGAHSDKCYLRMIQESLTVGMHSPDTEEIIGTWIEAWNTRHIPEGHVTKAHMDERIVQAVAAARKAWAQQATIPEGYALVPIEPTQRMLDAAQTAVNVGDAWTHKGVYKAMIEAAREEE